MSRFTDEERERIRSQLVEEGRSLFAQFGFERTRIKDITEAVGIGTSTFYQFFDSKEALYIEVLCVEREDLYDRLDDAIAEVDTQRAEVRAVLEALFREVQSNRLISRLLMEDERRVLQEELTEAERQSTGLDHSDSPHLQRWTENPAFRYDDPDVVYGILRSMMFTTRAREPLFVTDPTTEYEEIETQLIETLVDGMFVDPGDGSDDDGPDHPVDDGPDDHE